MFSSPSLASDILEGPLIKADVELQRKAALLEHSQSLRSEEEEERVLTEGRSSAHRASSWLESASETWIWSESDSAKTGIYSWT